MLLADPDGPMSLQPRSPGLGRISRPIRFAAPAILFFCCATFGATITRAQDQSVAEAARQERARKQELQKRAKHVYTEEDLKHPNILTPEDRAQIEAKRNECAQKNNCSPAPSQNLDANAPAPGTSLGEIARQLRKQRELQALKPKQTEPFHLPFETPALASPILPERPTIRPPAQPVLRPKNSSPKTSSNIFRRDPFSRVPVRPEVPRPEIQRSEIRPWVRKDVHPDLHASVRKNIRPIIRPKVGSGVYPEVREDVLPIVRPNVRPNFSNDIRPTLRAYRRMIAPSQPKIFSRPAPPSLLIQPMQPFAPSKPAQPAAPIVTVRPAQPRPALKSATVATQRTVNVQPGDSLWKLAQQNLGRGNRYLEFLAVNPGITNPNQIRAGAQINLPAAVATATSPRTAGNSAAQTIQVRKGDTLWALAKSNFGRSSAWPCLAAANPSISDPNRIYENQELLVPAACRP
jgi:nucleoid-associated protein YgaU